jgi:hypothetical protein
MKCCTAVGNEIYPGIKLWCDQPVDRPPTYKLHLPPKFWTAAISEAVLKQNCEQRGDYVALMRCSLLPNREIVCETEEDAAKDDLFVRGVLDKRQVWNTPERAQYRTALGGPRVWFHWLYESYLLNRTADGQTTGHEEYHFIAVMKPGDHVDADVFFKKEDGSPLGLIAGGTLLSYRGGGMRYLRYHRPQLIRQLPDEKTSYTAPDNFGLGQEPYCCSSERRPDHGQSGRLGLNVDSPKRS